MNVPRVNPRVDQIYQRDDNTVEIHVRTDSFKPGQEVEVSGYLIQGRGTYAASHVKKHIPLGADPSAVLLVQLPAMDLNPEEDLTVVTRVAEVRPAILRQETNARRISEGLKAVWTAEYPSGKEPGGPAGPRRNEGGRGHNEPGVTAGSSSTGAPQPGGASQAPGGPARPDGPSGGDQSEGPSASPPPTAADILREDAPEAVRRSEEIGLRLTEQAEQIGQFAEEQGIWAPPGTGRPGARAPRAA